MTPLQEQRLHTARLSRGVSSGPIYGMTLKIIQDLSLGPDLLDFGPGQGNLIRALLQNGYEGAITGVDLQSKPADLPEKVRWIETDLNDPLPLPDQSFSVILSTEVLTALENPRFVFREFSRLLRPGGVLLVTNPNQECIRSYVALLLGGHFAAFRGDAYPKAITALLRQDFERLCLETGFAPPRFYYSDSGGLPKLPDLHWQQLSLGLLKGCLFSDNVALVTRKL